MGFFHGVRCMAVRVVACLLLAVTGAAQVPAPRPEQALAVIPLAPLSSPSPEAPAQLREALVAQKATVMSVLEMRSRLRGPRTTGETQDPARMQTLLADVDKMYLGSRYKESLAIAEQVIKLLEADPSFSLEKAALLRTARIKAANILLTLAGGTETGRANTDQGKRAKAILREAVKAEPGLALSAADYTPRLRQLLEHARAELSNQPRGALVVESQPPGIPVFFEGQEVGFTPLNVAKVAPYGRYRVWLQQEERRSLQQWVEIGPTAAKVDVDYGYESLLQPHVPALAVDPLDLSDATANRTAEALGVSSVVFTHEYARDGGRWAGVMVYQVDHGFIRRAAVSMEEPGAMTVLAAFVATGASDGRLRRFAPPFPTVEPGGKLVLLPVVNAGVGSVEDVEKAIRDALAKTPRVDLLARDLTQRHLDAAKAEGAACAAHDVACKAALGRRMGVGTVVALRAFAVEKDAYLDVQVVDVESRRIVRRADGCLLGSAQAAPPQAAGHVVRLLAPAQFRSKLEVRGVVDGARLLVDGVDEGTVPTKGLLDLVPGRHVVRVVARALEAGERAVDLEYGATTVLVAERSGERVQVNPPAAALAAAKVDTSESPATDTSPAGATPSSGGRPVWSIPLAGGGAVSAVVGVLGMLVGGGLVATGVVLMMMFPKTASGRFQFQEGEGDLVGALRIGSAVAMVPVGALMGVVGLVLVLVGGVMAGGGVLGAVLLRRE